jgi:capsular polysaccharide biosynthesis protein
MESLRQQETTLRDYIRVLFRQRAVIITTFITVMLTVFIGLMLKTPIYEAQVKMLISAEKQIESPYYRELLTAGRNVEVALTQSEIVNSKPVLERVVAALGLSQKPLNYEMSFASPLKSVFIKLWVKTINAQLEQLSLEQKQSFLFRMAIETLKKNFRVEPIRDTNIFTISARDFSQVGSAIIANTISRSYQIFDLQQQLAELQLKYGEKHQTVLQLKDAIDKMISNLDGKPLSDIEAIGPASVKIVEQADIPLEPIGPPKMLIFILAFFMSIFLGIMLSFMFEYMDQTFKSPQEMEAYLNLPFLGSIPSKPKSKSFDVIAEGIQLISKDRNLKTLLFTTAQAGEDAANIVVNIGRTLAEKNHNKVLVIDANFRHLSFKKFLNLPSGPGLVDVIEEKVTFEKSVQTVGKNLAVLSAGETQLNPITVVDSGRMNMLLSEASQKYDLVLISAPDLTHKDSIQLSAHVDAVILVVNEGATRKQAVNTSLAPLKEKKANILGVILNNRTFAIPKAIYDRV